MLDTQVKCFISDSILSEGWSRMQQAEVDMNGETDCGKDSHSLSCLHSTSATLKRQMASVPTHQNTHPFILRLKCRYALYQYCYGAFKCIAMSKTSGTIKHRVSVPLLALTVFLYSNLNLCRP